MAESFEGVIAFAFMSAMILVGTVLRARLRFIQVALIPASLLGGTIGFFLITTGFSFGFESQDFVAFAFHFFTLSFMSLVLTGKENTGAAPTSVKAGGLWLSVGWTMSLALQALVGLIALMAFNAATGGELSHYLGIIVTHGFTQGPGQAMAMGSIWQNEFGVDDAVNFGLIYASLGFIISFIVGVPAARYAIKKGLNTNTAARLDEAFLKGVHPDGIGPSAGKQVTHSANVDSLVFHISILGVAYLVTDTYLKQMQIMTDGVTLMGLPTHVFFSHNLFFIHGLMVCLLIRSLVDRLGYGHYMDNETQKRITGSSVDLMMTATVMSIQFALLSQHFGVIMLVCLSVAATTALLCFGFGRLLNTLPAERAITLFGCCTGSTGSGLLLLRILDPDLSTPVARELAWFNVAIIFLSLHILMLMAPILPSLGLATVAIVYGATVMVGAGLLWWLSPKT